jgi:hypothetical protein
VLPASSRTFTHCTAHAYCTHKYRVLIGVPCYDTAARAAALQLMNKFVSVMAIPSGGGLHVFRRAMLEWLILTLFTWRKQLYRWRAAPNRVFKWHAWWRQGPCWASAYTCALGEPKQGPPVSILLGYTKKVARSCLQRFVDWAGPKQSSQLCTGCHQTHFTEQ